MPRLRISFQVFSWRLLCLRCSVFLFAIISVMLAPGVRAATITVNQDGSGDFVTIQEGIDAAAEGDEVVVFPGTYVENIVFKGKNIVLRSTEPTSSTVVNSTIIRSARRSFPVVAFSGSESLECILSGFVITNGDNTSTYGGGILGKGTHATITNNTITKNHSSSGGGGLHDCDGLIQGNIISHNENSYSLDGAGMLGCDGIIRNNIIHDNYRQGIVSYGTALIESNLIYNNKEGIVGSATIQNNIIYNNDIGIRANSLLIQNNTIYGNQLVGIEYCDGIIRNNILWGNAERDKYGYTAGIQIINSRDPEYSCIQNWSEQGNNNINVDPLFINPESNDFRLRENSPCVDSGTWIKDLRSDYDGSRRPVGMSYDIGAHEQSSLLYVYPLTNSNSLHIAGNVIKRSNLRFYMKNTLPDKVITWEATTSASWIDMNKNAGFLFPQKSTELRLELSDDAFKLEPGLYEASVSIQNTRTGEGDTVGTIRLILSDEGDVWHVPGSVSTIQRAITYAEDGMTIIIDPGIYYENLIMQGCDIIVRSIQPDNLQIVKRTVIHGQNKLSVIRFTGKESEACTVEGLTITKGKSVLGGGIVGFGTKASIRQNIIEGNASDAGGGLSNCDGLIRENIISNNEARVGGGLHWCDGSILNNYILNNHARDIGGGLFRCQAVIYNNTIFENSASDGSALSYCSGRILNCIIGKISARSSNKLIHESSTPSYSFIQNWDGGGEGNIAEDPMFVDAENGDFHLLPGSPCIDTGSSVSLALDFDGEARPFDGDGLGAGTTGDGSDFDIGADEFAIGPYNMRQHIGGRFELPGHFIEAMDANGDGVVDVADIVRFLREQGDAAEAAGVMGEVRDRSVLGWDK